MKAQRRLYGTYTTTVDVDVDVAEVVAELSDDEIRAECKLRGIETLGGITSVAEEWRDFAEELRDARDDAVHFEVLIVRMFQMAGVPPLKIKAAA